FSQLLFKPLGKISSSSSKGLDTDGTSDRTNQNGTARSGNRSGVGPHRGQFLQHGLHEFGRTIDTTSGDPITGKLDLKRSIHLNPLCCLLLPTLTLSTRRNET